MIEQTDGIGRHQKVLEALQYSELRYRRLFESARDGILIFDAYDQKIIDANPALVELLGYSRDELLGKDLRELGLFKDRVKGDAAIRQLLATGHLTYEDLRLETKAGENRDVEFTASVYEEGTRRIIQCNVRDVTEHKNIEAAQREQVDLLTVAQRIGRMGNWSLDLISGGLVWSEATCELFGITRAEFDHTYDHFYSFILAEDRTLYNAAHALVSAAAPVFEVEYRIRRSDGTVRWLYERGQMEFDETGVRIGGAGIVIDITERHATREKLAQNAALLAQIAGKAARLGGWSIQLPERTLTWSDENCAIHDLPPGYTPTLEEGIGYFPLEHRAEVLRYVAECAQDGTPYDFELPKYTAKGRLIWVRSIGEAVRDADGKIIRLQGAFQDITRRKLAEAEREKLIRELQDALLEVKTLREFLPICSYCKKVRDDQNYWSQIESYISKHTGTRFTHGICPECYEIEVSPQLEELRRRGNADRQEA